MNRDTTSLPNHAAHYRADLTIKIILRKLLAYLLISLFISTVSFADNSSLVGIQGVDDRVIVNGSQAPWQAIGKVYTADLFACTGVLIDAKHVLTAAHCIWNKKNNKLMPTDYIHFETGHHRDVYLAARAVKRIKLPARYKFSQKQPINPGNLALDWAILELDTPINSVRPMPLSLLSVKELIATGQNTAVIQAGFSGDRQYILTANKRCKIIKQYKKHPLVKHNCDATNGDSGSPLLIKEQGDYHVIAMLVAARSSAQRKPTGLAVIIPPDQL